jgi:hypothetical protein
VKEKWRREMEEENKRKREDDRRWNEKIKKSTIPWISPLHPKLWNYEASSPPPPTE